MANDNGQNEATKRAVAMLSDENRKWLQSWIDQGWNITISEKSYDWNAVKLFAGDAEPSTLYGFGSLNAILKAVETEEYRRKLDSEFERAQTQPPIVHQFTFCLACGEPGNVLDGFCEPCKSAGTEFKVPSESEFIDSTAEFLIAPEIANIGQRLISTYEEDFWVIKHARIDYLWKRAGGEKAGRATLGTLRKVSGELKFYSQKDYICAISADHCHGLNPFQITALVFHELKHGYWDHEKAKYSLIGHDFEGFRREVELFGYWKPDIKAIAKSFAVASQQNLFESMGARS
jgi:hypothetical protein